MAVKTQVVKFKSGKFAGEKMTINADSNSQRFARERIGDFDVVDKSKTAEPKTKPSSSKK